MRIIIALTISPIVISFSQQKLVSCCEDQPHQLMIQEFINFFTSYQDFLSPLLTGIFTLLLFIGKEFWEANRTKRKEQKEKLDVFGLYGYPLLDASRELVERLFDILLEKPRYLRKDAPESEYYKYHYISTIYRMNSVLGWIRAIRREISKMEVGKASHNQELEKAIKDFQTSLASNVFLHGQQVDYLINRWELTIPTETKDLTTEDKNKLELDIEVVVSTFMKELSPQRPWEIEREKKLELLKQVRAKLAEATQHPGPFDDSLITKFQRSCIRVISRRVSWIYLDWQRAIGDFMLKQNTSEFALRRLELKSFHEFEDDFQAYKKEGQTNRWIARVDRLFHDLQPGSSILFDTRDQQLEQVSGKLINLIDVLRKAGIGSEHMKEEDMARLLAKQAELEARMQQEKAAR
ncbi:MAG: hypothetical protein Sapg2KO_44340 [Saprospiraceae bacterium]